MKKVITIIVVVLLIGAALFGIYYGLNSKNKADDKINSSANNSLNSDKDSKDKTSSAKKILVVYYSAQTHTEKVAKEIASNLNADIFKIEPKDVYTTDDLNWSNDKSRVSREHDDESLRNVELKTTKVDNWDSYDTVLIGYPIWWGVAAWPVNTFVKANDFDGKTVIPFCTSASSGIGNSGKLLEGDAGSGKWLSGQRFSSSPSTEDIKEFTDSIK